MSDFLRFKTATTTQETNLLYKIQSAREHLIADKMTSYENNGDEEDFPNMVGQFHKSLLHDANGLVNTAEYQKLLTLMSEPTQANLIAISQPNATKLSDPLSSFTRLLYGDDPHYLATLIPPAPKINSRLAAADLLCVYGMALLRDVKFADFATDPTVAMIATELANFPELSPYMAWPPTPANLFRDKSLGCTKGGYVSQFLLQDIPSYEETTEQKKFRYMPGEDKILTNSDFLDNMNGIVAGSSINQEAQRRFIQTGRDGAQLVHTDQFTQIINQVLYILGFNGYAAHPTNSPFSAAELASCRPCVTSAGAQAYVDCHIAAEIAIVAAFVSKWVVNRRCRPEYMAMLVDQHKNAVATHPLHADLLSSPILDAVHTKWGNYLLPQVYPEGSPSHPAYPAGHASVAWATCFVLKAYFDPAELMKTVVEPSSDGFSLNTIANTANLNVEDELHKAAANISWFRNWAGVHYPTDGHAQKEMCRQLVKSVLRDRSKCGVRQINYTFRDDEGNNVDI